MINEKPKVTLVIPVFNDSQRLSSFGPQLAHFLKHQNTNIVLLISDDGSHPQEQQKLQAVFDQIHAVYPNSQLIFNSHLGKGGAVRSGWSHAQDSDFLAFVDADGSISPEDICQLIEENITLSSSHAVISSRRGIPNHNVFNTWTRNLGNRFFATLARLTIKLKLTDTQCGAKVIPAPAFRNFQSTLVEDGLAFDCELLKALAQNNITIKERPIHWVERAHGPVKPFRDIWPMLLALYRLRKRIRSGHYTPHPSPTSPASATP